MHLRRRALPLILLLLTACTGRPTDAPTPTTGPLGVHLPTPTPRATRQAGERTPPPTFTPAPTATPVIHIVQPGETLIDIAQKYGITLDALQAANGVLKPENLLIGQQLIIPIGASAARPAPGGGLLLPTPTPLPAQVLGTALYETPAGSLFVLGEVYNPLETSLENAQVRAALLDASGMELASNTTFVALDVIPPGGKAPFGVPFAPPPQGVASFSVTILRAEASAEPGNRYMPIAVASREAALDGLQFRVTGSIANQGPFNAVDVNVVVTTYDEAGRVTGYRQATVGDGTLGANAAVEFAINLAPNVPPGQLPFDYAVAAQGRTAQP